MAVYDLEEQENIDNLKAWWKQYGRLVIAAAVAFALGVGGIQAWRYYKQEQSLKAAAVFAELEEAVRINDGKKSLELSRRLMADFARTAYGARGALLVAKQAFDSSQFPVAEEQLRWAAANARDPQTGALASLRLGAVLQEQKKYPEALQALSVAAPEPFVALFADARGDIFVAQGKIDEARGAYQVALDKLPKSNQYRNLVEIKRDALGAK